MFDQAHCARLMKLNDLGSVLLRCALVLAIAMLCSACPDVTDVPDIMGAMAGEMPAGEISAGEEPAGEIGAGEMPAGEEGGNTNQLRQLGDPCTSVAQCESGICFSEGVDEQGLCTSACDSEESECPLEGFVCRSTTSFGYICIPAEVQGPCSPCEESYECGDNEDYCIFFPNEQASFCTSGCTDNSECPAGHSCTYLGGEVNQCFPDNGLNQCNVIDTDDDGISDEEDNCPQYANPEQSDQDADGIGDACDLCPDVSDPSQSDSDEDGLGDACDLCPDVSDPTQLDSDNDGIGNACDNCPETSNPDQSDSDNDGIGDACVITGEISFSLGGPVSATSLSSSPSYTLVGGMIGAQRSGVLIGPNYQARPYPSAAQQ
jgi:hypothetical protein